MPCALRSRRFTPRSLNAWRVERKLYVREMADLLGFSVSRLKDKLYGRTAITMQMDRAIANIEYCISRDVAPDGWPVRLRRLIAATSSAYIDEQSSRAPDSSPENLT